MNHRVLLNCALLVMIFVISCCTNVVNAYYINDNGGRRHPQPRFSTPLPPFNPGPLKWPKIPQ